MCYEWKFKAMNECSMKVKRIYEKMWENNNQLQKFFKVLNITQYIFELRKISVGETLYFLD